MKGAFSMKSIRVLSVLVACAAFLCLAQLAAADDKAAASDQQFVTKAATCGMTEVRLGKLAMERATNPAVKQYGEQMMKDHGHANKELTTLAGQKKLSLPRGIDQQHEELITRLTKL